MNISPKDAVKDQSRVQMRLSFPPKILSAQTDLPVHRGRHRQNGLSTTTLTVLTVSSVYTLFFLYYHFASARDPTSYFFDKNRAYKQGYSRSRIEQADSFIKQVSTGVQVPKHNSHTPHLCVGVTTVVRRGDQYVSTTVGSLVEGLTQSEREGLYLNVLIAHTDPTTHPNASDRWMQTVPDRVLHYDPDGPDFDKLVAWEKNGLYRNKTIYDYTYLLKDCYNTGADYVLMVEDDTLAARDWYARTIESLDIVIANMQTLQSRWAYLRLFYVEDLLGWNSEEWPKYLFWSFIVWSIVTTGMVSAKRRFRWQLEGVTYPCITILAVVFIPLSIGLHFMAGRQTMWPIPAGVHSMNQYGCCSQALVFPRSIIPTILSRSDLTTDWLVDMMIEKIADREGLERWVVVPALIQHVGATSSKGYGFDDSAKELWNFRFEDHPIRQVR